VTYSAVTRLRRLSQAVCLGLFVLHVCSTEYRGSFHSSGAEIRLAFPVRLLLDFDPLLAITNALATRALYQGMLWSLTILIPTLFLGRFFCGWMCPLGTLNHFFSHMKSEKKRGPQRIAGNRYKPWQTLKYYLLIALLVVAFFHGALVGIVDPLSLLVRSLALSILPALNYALQALLNVSVLSFRQPQFRQGFLLGMVLITILTLNLRITRFWCRALCPLGALLGLVSRWSILGLEKHPTHCGDCNRCLLHCQGGDDPIPGALWRKAECHLCMNCVADCPESGIRFRLFPRTPTTVDGADLKRRKALVSLAAGVAALPLLRSNAGLAVEQDARLIRPPGALNEAGFLARCIRCGQCMKVCPNHALHPAFTEAGWEGIWTPVLVPRIGYCEPSCTLCSQVCPTGAIWDFTAKEKAWAAEQSDPHATPIRLGTAFYDRGRCLPWSMATECIVCEEWCPTSPKAIYLRAAEVTDAQGNIKRVRQPYVEPERCVGCGACEFACPVKDRPAVYVTSVGESRSTTNQILLRPPKKEAASFFPETGVVAGWSQKGDPRTFEAGNLWQYIDGDADRYLQAGVERTLTANYRYQDKTDAVADIYVMRNSDGARKILESESAVGSQTLSLGDAGRLYGASLTFRRGRYFVRLVAYEEARQVTEALVNLGRGIDARLRDVASVASERDNNKNGSERL